MSEPRENIPVLQNPDGSGEALSKIEEGDAVSGQKGLMAFLFQDVFGAAVFPELGKRNEANSIGVVLAADSLALHISGAFNAVAVSTTPVLVKAGPAQLADRQTITATPTNGKIYWGYDNTVDSTTGTPIFKNQTAAWLAAETFQIWMVAASGTIDVRVTEAG